MATTTLSQMVIQKMLVELAPQGRYPLLDMATRYKPSWKDEPITRVNFIDYDGNSAVADDVTGGITGTAYVTTSSRAWTTYRANWPLMSTSTEGTGAPDFWRQNGLDQMVYRINNEIENTAITTLAAAATASTIYTENTHIVGGANTTLDAMTAAQRVAYFNHLFATMRTKTDVIPDTLIVPIGYASTFLNDLQSITISASGAAVTVQTGVQILPEVETMYKNIKEDAALTFAGFPGARTNSPTLYAKKAAVLMSSSKPALEYAEWNYKLDTGMVPRTLTMENILEMNSSMSMQYLKPVAYLTLAWT